MNRFRCLLIAMTLIFVTPFGVHADGSIGETSVENFCEIKNTTTTSDTDMLVPDKLKKGDKVGIIAPANPATDDSLSRATDILENAGFVPVISDDIKCGWIGDPTGEKRAAAFNKLVSDSTIKAIICLRGGYGSMHIIDKIDYAMFRKNRPILVGYSDITALHMAIYKNAHVITFHGPMLSSNYGQKESFECLFNMLMDNLNNFELSNIDNSDFKTLKKGIAQGELVGGNMVLISALMGTDYEINTEGKILFIEELEEPLYRLDRILHQLKLAGKFDKVAGIIIGDIYKCDSGDGSALQGVLNFFKENVDVPVIYNVHAGHNTNPITLPLGAQVRIEDNCCSLIQKVVK